MWIRDLWVRKCLCQNLSFCLFLTKIRDLEDFKEITYYAYKIDFKKEKENHNNITVILLDNFYRNFL